MYKNWNYQKPERIVHLNLSIFLNENDFCKRKLSLKVQFNHMFTPFENAQRWMGKNTFPILLLNDDDMIGEH